MLIGRDENNKIHLFPSLLLYLLLQSLAMKQTTLLIVIVLGLLWSCQPTKKQSDSNQTGQLINQPIPYNLTQPTDRYTLPKDLREISGLSYYKPGKLACIQDELAIVFIYDLNRRRVVDEVIFGTKGDYEGVEWVNEELYALRSDGELYHFPDNSSGSKYVAHTKIGLPGKNDVEGLGYDPTLNALLMAVKDGKGTDKLIYYYDLKHRTLFQGLVLKQGELQKFDPEIGRKANGKGQKIPQVKPSGIAVQPKTGDYYVLAAEGSRLLVVNRKGKVQSSVALDKALFKQPEGICFAPDGTLYIASEGGDLLQFGMKQ